MKKLRAFFFYSVLSLWTVSCKPTNDKLQSTLNTALGSSGVTVHVKDGVASLSGEVANEATRDAAEQAAKIKGIDTVINNITIKPIPSQIIINPDDVLKSAIENDLLKAGYKGINVSASHGEAILTGKVKKADIKDILKVAHQAKPKKLINNLTVKS